MALAEQPEGAPAPFRRSARLNPRQRDRVERAKKFREEFHWGIPAKKILRRKVSPPPKVLVGLGALEAVTYRTNKKGDGPSSYIHDFEAPRPVLAMDVDNRRLHIVGGGYDVEDRGIVR